MAYSRAIVQRAEARLQSEKEQNERSSRARIAAIYEKEPRLGEIERELRRTAAHVLAATFRRQGDPVAAMQQLKKENLALQQERDWILQAEGLEPDDLTVQPICPTCGGTGYVGAAMCECLKELCRQEQKKELTNLFGAESFEKFRLDLYSDQYDAKYRSSPRELMRATYRMAQNYAQSFPADGQSLVFSGATGLGKTFLSACVARVVAERGFSVSYAPVGQLFAAFAQSVRQSYQGFQQALAAGPTRHEKLVLQVPLTMASRDLVYHDLLMALSQELPDCDLEVRTDTSCTSPEEVLQSGVDALIQILLEPVSDAIDCLPLFDTKCHLLASPGSPLSVCGDLTPDQLTGQTVCFESCDAVFASMVRRCMEEVPLRWLMVPDFEKEYVRMLAGKCLFLSPVRSHGYPPEWFHPLQFPFPPSPTCLFTRKDDTRPCLQILQQLTLAEHRRAVADGRL